MTKPLYFGGDYNPDQWSPSIWKEDAELMQWAGVNLATVGVFSWSQLEPRPGQYEFGWLDTVLDQLADHGVGVDLATPTASPPPWFSLQHPEALPVRADGTRLTHGSRDTYCVCSPAYREAAKRICGVLADRYVDHPALTMWHVHNEYGTVCYCDQAAASFRTWLQHRYGDLDALNAAWTTAFWSQRYSDWAEVMPPRATQYLVNPAQFVDYRRFWSDELLAAFKEQQSILRAATPDIPITTNFVFGNWVPVDHHRWSDAVDLVAIDNYPSGTGLAPEEQTAFAADQARGWARRGEWLLMEQAPGAIIDGARLRTKEPGRMTRMSLSHVARGSRGALFFQWRASAGGSEQFHPGMVPHAGQESRRFLEICELGGLLGRLGEISGSQVEAEVAVLWDAEAWWAMQGTHLPSSDLDYLEAVQSAHRQLWRAGIGADVIHPSADLTPYRVVVVPSLYLVDPAHAAALREYVASGGHVLVTYFSGIVDPNCRVFLGGYPGAFRELLGIRVEEFYPVAETELADAGRARWWSEQVDPEGAEVVDVYAAGPLAGAPAITRHTFGGGEAWYVSTQLEDAGYQRLVETICRRAGVLVPELPESVEVVRRRQGDTTWTFLLNHGIAEATIEIDGHDLVSGQSVEGSLTLKPGDQAVVERTG
ncbi:beta-galactosidase [Kribbella sp. NPDC005582]|uniref:beta-galactosidase n=1 Tax=Kribbella sp. NPDC005582 TaxID=3156893 RepID=UPI0033B6CF1E